VLDQTATLLFTLFVLLSSVGLMAGHMRSWGASRRAELDPAERDFRRRQFRRRMQTSALLGVLAVAVLAGRWMMTLRPAPLLVVGYWGGVFLLLAWLALLAAADVLATKHHYARVRDECRVEQAKLQAILRRWQATRGNGRAAGGGKDPAAGLPPND